MPTDAEWKGARGVQFEPTQLNAVLADLGLGALALVTPLEGGQERSFRIDRVGQAPLVLKTFTDATSSSMGKEMAAARLLGDLAIPVTRFLAMDDTCRRLPFRFTIATYLPGERVTRFKGEPDIADLFGQMGAMLRQLHTVALPEYGALGPDGIAAGTATNEQYVASLFDHGFERFRHFGGDAKLALRLEAIIAKRAAVICHSQGPVFAHDDFQPNNLLAARDEQGRLHLTGLIDFGNARASDALCDLAKALFCCEHEMPGSAGLVRAGYGPIEHPDPDAALWVYLVLHRLTMWWWLRQVGVFMPDERHGLLADLEAMADEATL